MKTMTTLVVLALAVLASACTTGSTPTTTVEPTTTVAPTTTVTPTTSTVATTTTVPPTTLDPRLAQARQFSDNFNFLVLENVPHLYRNDYGDSVEGKPGNPWIIEGADEAFGFLGSSEELIADAESAALDCRTYTTFFNDFLIGKAPGWPTVGADEAQWRGLWFGYTVRQLGSSDFRAFHEACATEWNDPDRWVPLGADEPESAPTPSSIPARLPKFGDADLNEYMAWEIEATNTSEDLRLYLESAPSPNNSVLEQGGQRLRDIADRMWSIEFADPGFDYAMRSYAEAFDDVGFAWQSYAFAAGFLGPAEQAEAEAELAASYDALQAAIGVVEETGVFREWCMESSCGLPDVTL
jgi:hypothetical protein